MASYPVSARYAGGGNNAAWFVPFPYGNDAEVAVSLVGADGQERRLKQGSDYLLSGNQVICIVPEGAILVIWLNASPEQAEAGAASQALNGLGANGNTLTINTRAASASIAPAQEAAPLSMAAATEAATEMATQAPTQAQLADAQAVAQEAEQAVAAASIARDAATEAGNFASRAYTASEQAQESIAKTQALAASAENSAADAQNACNAASLAATSCARCLDDSQKASLEARQAASLATQNAGQIGDCATACAEIYEATKKTGECAWHGSAAAWRAAAVASLHHHRPGISVVRNLGQIAFASPGLFIVNPRITHAPSPFMGIWPAADTAAMTWDGIFFIGPAWPEKLTFPPKNCVPCRPGNLESSRGDGDDWLPCHHYHHGPCQCLKPQAPICDHDDCQAGAMPQYQCQNQGQNQCSNECQGQCQCGGSENV